eukprot:CAMPEP_0185791192 /NCGR_PEP_ID=MMETSP1174-20130828/158237_1 /TAXON_ID=35687 /ORGANISM="Dictyocha speculum, Strain CCMP1381" /LENGTH=168 /DNA_ID=CAMNT_0028486107 /DNA_START=365 /DNA_END=871 /DNA_ORIENTATION=-
MEGVFFLNLSHPTDSRLQLRGQRYGLQAQQFGGQTPQDLDQDVPRDCQCLDNDGACICLHGGLCLDGDDDPCLHGGLCLDGDDDPCLHGGLCLDGDDDPCLDGDRNPELDARKEDALYPPHDPQHAPNLYPPHNPHQRLSVEPSRPFLSATATPGCGGGHGAGHGEGI